mgnify:CR=1 FL=1
MSGIAATRLLHGNENCSKQANLDRGHASGVAPLLTCCCRTRIGQLGRPRLAWITEIRHLLRRPALTVSGAILCGTAVALSSTTFAIADAAWLRPFLFPESQNIHAVHAITSSGGRQSTIPRVVFERWYSALGESQVVAYSLTAGSLESSEGAAQKVLSVLTFGNLPKVLGLTAVPNHGYRDDIATGLLSQRYWETTLDGDRDAIGTIGRYNGLPILLGGIMPTEASLPLLPPVAMFLRERPGDGQGDLSMTTDLVSVLVNTKDATHGSFVMQQILDDLKVGVRVDLVPLSVVVEPQLESFPLLLLALAFAIVLIVAITGYLVSVDWLGRATELSIRSALGASSGQLERLLVVQLGAIVAMGLAGGIATSWTSLQLFGAELKSGLVLPRIPGIDGVSISLSLGLAGVLVAALWILARRKLAVDVPALMLRNSGIAQNLSPRRARAFLVAQLLLGGVLVAVALRSALILVAMSDDRIGVDVSGVISSQLVLKTRERNAGHALAVFNDVRENLSRILGIAGISLVELLPFHDVSPWYEEIRPVGASNGIKASVRRVDSSYFQVLGIELLVGRPIQELDMNRTPMTAVVSSSLATARFGGVEDAVGKAMSVGAWTVEIVGVAGDVRDVSLDLPPGPTVYLPNTDPEARSFSSMRGILLKVDVGQEGRVAREASKVLARYAGFADVLPPDDLADRLGYALRAPTVYAWLASVFGWVALVIGVLGTYSVSSRLMQAQTHDNTIRLALGASRFSLLKHLGWLVLPSIVLGVGLGLVAGVWVGYVLSPDDLDLKVGMPSLQIGMATLGVAALLAVVPPMWRSSRISLRDSASKLW